MARFARFVAAAELPVIIAIAPLLLFPTRRHLVVLAVVPIIWLCARIAGGHIVPRTPMNAALWLMLAMVGVSLYATFDIGFSLGKVAGVVLGVLLFWAVARWLTTPERLRLATAVFLLAGAALAVLGLLGAPVQTRRLQVLAAVTTRLPIVIRGVPGAEEGFNANPVAGALVLFVPLQVALLATGAHEWSRSRRAPQRTGKCLIVIQGILLFLTAGTVLLMQSRGAWMGLVVAIWAFLTWRGRMIRVLSAVVVGAAIVLVGAVGPTELLDLAVSRSGQAPVDTVTVRLQLWSSALHGIKDYPFTGMGMNAFRKIMMTRYLTPLVKAHYTDVSHAHNHLLQAALDLGIPGLVTYASIWIIAAALLVMVYRRSGTRFHRVMAGGLGAGLIAHFIFSMTDAIPLGAKVGVLFWLALSLTVGLHRVAIGDGWPQQPSSR